MYKQSNVSSELLNQMVKAAESAKPRDFKSDFIDQITPILTTQPKTLRDVFADVLKTAQFDDPMADHVADPVGGMGGAEEPGLDAGAELGGEGDLGEELPGDDLGGDLGDELETGGGSLADQLRSLADQVEQLEGGGEDSGLEEEMGLGDEVDISGVDEEIPTDTGVGDMVGSEDPISSLPEESKPMAAPMYMAMAKQLRKTAMLVSSKGISKRKS